MLVDQGSRLPCSAFAPSEIENSLYTDERDKRAVIDLSCPKQDRVEINSCNFVGIWHGLTP